MLNITGCLGNTYFFPFLNDYELCWTEAFLWQPPSKMNHEGRNLRKEWFGASNGGREQSVNLMKRRDRSFIRTRLTAEGVEGGLHEHQRIDMILLRMAEERWVNNNVRHPTV